MAWYWRVRDLPELRDLPKRVRRQWWSEALRESRPAAERWAYFLLVFGIFTVEGDLAQHFHRSWLEHWAAVAITAAIIGFVYSASIEQPRARRWLQEHLHETWRIERTPSPVGGDHFAE